MKKERMNGYNDLVKIFQEPQDNDEYNNYDKLPAQTAQWTIKKVIHAWSSFFRAIKSYKKHPELFTGRPGMPGYKNKDGEFILIFTNQQCKIVNGVMRFPRIMDLEVETRLNDIDKKNNPGILRGRDRECWVAPAKFKHQAYDNFQRRLLIMLTKTIT